MTTETLLGRDVLLEDGLVVMPAGKNRRVIWVQCPTCGPQVPATARTCIESASTLLHHKGTHRQHRPGLWPAPRPIICSVCDQDGAYKEILIPREQARRHERCTVRCLDGKTFCACGCRGRCHGESKCTCKEEADA